MSRLNPGAVVVAVLVREGEVKVVPRLEESPGGLEVDLESEVVDGCEESPGGVAPAPAATPVVAEGAFAKMFA